MISTLAPTPLKLSESVPEPPSIRPSSEPIPVVNVKLSLPASPSRFAKPENPSPLILPEPGPLISKKSLPLVPINVSLGVPDSTVSKLV